MINRYGRPHWEQFNTFHHSVFNIKTNNFTQVDTTKIKNKVADSYLGSVYLKTKQMILLIDSQTMYSYNLISNQWNPFKIKLPGYNDYNQNGLDLFDFIEYEYILFASINNIICFVFK